MIVVRRHVIGKQVENLPGVAFSSILRRGKLRFARDGNRHKYPDKEARKFQATYRMMRLVLADNRLKLG